MTFKLSCQQARQVILHLQGLSHPPNRRLDPDALYGLIHQLGFVQLDSIQWVERAHHMILFARSQAYRPKHLTRLLERDQRLFEHWTHDASVIPSEFYRYWRHKFDRERPKMAAKFERWQGPGYVRRCEDLHTRITQEGPLRSREVERQDSGPQEMWQWHDGKAALEFLWRTGQLCISKREGFQKVYDLACNGLSSEDFDATVSHEAFVDWACRSAIERLGFGTPADIARYWDLISIAEARAWVEEQGPNTLRPVTVCGIKGTADRTLMARADIESIVETLPLMPKRVRVLSPFDPVIRDRKRLSWLFGFDYRIEIYVPEEKRQWGYYVFPLLEGDRLIGRIDMRALRKRDALQVKKIWLEPKIKMSNARRDRLDSELVRQARLAGVGSVSWLEGALD